MAPLEDPTGAVAALDPENITIATVCSHTSLQIFDGARKEGFKTLGIAVGKPPRFYDAFPRAKPDEFLLVESYPQIPKIVSKLQERNCVIVPHGSVVQYLGIEAFEELPVATFGNRNVLRWESDRDMERQWLTSAGLSMPREIPNPEAINCPVLVKYDGARGGRGFFIARTADEFRAGVIPDKKFSIQEYILGTRYYLHFFYSPLHDDGYRLTNGRLELLSMDRRDETNIDEMYKLGSQETLKRVGIYPSFVVTGNIPLVLRESLLPKAFEMGEMVVERSLELFGGMIGSFCLETVVTDQLEFKVFEISGRIVAGTNPFISGSPYSDLAEPGISTGQRIAREVRVAIDQGRLNDILS